MCQIVQRYALQVKLFNTFLFCLILFGVSGVWAQQDARLNIQDLRDLEDMQRGENLGAFEGDQDDQGAEEVFFPYDPKYRPAQYPHLTGGDTDQAILSHSHFTLRFVRLPLENTENSENTGTDPNKVTLRISQDVVASGCMTVVMPPPTIRISGQMMRVMLDDPTVSIKKDALYAHHECDVRSRVVYTDAVFDKAVLAEQNVTSVLFSNAFGTDVYTLSVGRDHISLTPKTQNVFAPVKASPDRDPLKYWLYPDHTIMVSVPMARKEERFVALDALKAWAAHRNLKPLDMVLDFFAHPVHSSTIYYVDETGHIAAGLTDKHMSPVGQVSIPEIWHGAGGAYDRLKSMTVMAKRPGVYE